MIFFLDLESAGLDPRDPILEIGLLAVTDDLQTEVACYSNLVEVSPVIRAGADGFVQKMHTDNGLWQALDNGEGRPESQVREEVLAFLAQWGSDSKAPYCWGGSGVNHYDSGVLAAQWPEIRALLYYRADLDVSSVRSFATLAGIPELYSKDDVPHRALPDCRLALDQARYYLDLLRRAR